MEWLLEVACVACPPELEEDWLKAARIILKWMGEVSTSERRDRPAWISALAADEQAKLGQSPAIRTAPAVNVESIALADEIV